MLGQNPIVSSLISLVVVAVLSALVLGLCKPKIVHKSKASKELACDKLAAWSILFGVIVALIVLAIGMSRKQPLGMGYGMGKWGHRPVYAPRRRSSPTYSSY